MSTGNGSIGDQSSSITLLDTCSDFDLFCNTDGIVSIHIRIRRNPDTKVIKRVEVHCLTQTALVAVPPFLTDVLSDLATRFCLIWKVTRDVGSRVLRDRFGEGESESEREDEEN